MATTLARHSVLLPSTLIGACCPCTSLSSGSGLALLPPSHSNLKLTANTTVYLLHFDTKNIDKKMHIEVRYDYDFSKLLLTQLIDILT